MRWSYPPTAGLFSLDGRVWRLLVFCPALQMPLASRQPEEGSHPKFLEEAIDLQTGPKNTRIPSSTSFLSSLSSSYQTMVRSLVWSGLAIYPTTNMTHAPALARCGRRLATVFFFWSATCRRKGCTQYVVVHVSKRHRTHHHLLPLTLPSLPTDALEIKLRYGSQQ